MDRPNLIESTTKNYLFNTLKQCHNHRVSIYYYALNIGVFLVFAIVVGVTLYYCSKKKLTDYEKQQKMYEDQKYILSKIRFYKEDQKQREQSQGSSITNLPFTSG